MIPSTSKVGLACVVGLRGLETAALVDRHVDEHGAALHLLQHRAGHELGRAGAGDEHGAHHDIGAEHLCLDGLERGGERAHAAFEQLIELAQTRQRAVEDGNFRAETGGHACRMRADDTAAQHHDLRGANARNAAHKNAAPAGRAAQALAAASMASRPATSLIGASNGSAPAKSVTVSYAMAVAPEAMRPRACSGSAAKMQVGEEDLVGPQPRGTRSAAAPSP